MVLFRCFRRPSRSFPGRRGWATKRQVRHGASGRDARVLVGAQRHIDPIETKALAARPPRTTPAGRPHPSARETQNNDGARAPTAFSETDFEVSLRPYDRLSIARTARAGGPTRASVSHATCGLAGQSPRGARGAPGPLWNRTRAPCPRSPRSGVVGFGRGDIQTLYIRSGIARRISAWGEGHISAASAAQFAGRRPARHGIKARRAETSQSLAPFTRVRLRPCARRPNSNLSHRR